MFKNNETTAAYLGSFIATLSGWTISDWAAAFGILFGLATLLINWYYKQKEFKLKELAVKNRLAQGQHQDD